MRWTLPDGIIIEDSRAMKQLCERQGWDWSYFRNHAQKGLDRRVGGSRRVRLPDDWRARLDAIFGADAVVQFSKEAPPFRPAIVVTTNATDTAWYHALAAHAAAMCLVRGRINYVDLDTEQQLKGNPKGTIFLLLAEQEDERKRFAEALQNIGAILLRMSAP